MVADESCGHPAYKSIGAGGYQGRANYVEADDAPSKRGFLPEIATCKKEAKETKHWLQMIIPAAPDTREEARRLWQEARDFN